jgi:hypothetical protein
MESLFQLLTQFRQAAERAGNISDPKAQNKAARKVQECYRLLSTTAEGRTGIMGLMGDANPNVRLCAAARSLQWSPAKARKVLEALRDERAFPYSFDAEMTLVEFDNGSLSFDY